jgi:hypothetical protein
MFVINMNLPKTLPEADRSENYSNDWLLEPLCKQKADYRIDFTYIIRIRYSRCMLFYYSRIISRISYFSQGNNF